MTALLTTGSQALALLLVGIVLGSMFGIWRGYDVTTYSPSTFVEVQQGAVRGLNTLLPGLAAIAIALTVLLAGLGRGRPLVLGLYLLAVAALIAGGLITRFANQPINDQIMLWTPTSMPADWMGLRESWWHWHQARLVVTLLANLVLIAAIFADREGGHIMQPEG